MRTPSKIITALALAGLAVAGGAAFTATGVDTQAGDTQFIGGTVSQTVTGAVLNKIVYTAPGNGEEVTGISITFASPPADGATIQAFYNNSAPGEADGTEVVFSVAEADGTASTFSKTGLTITGLEDLDVVVGSVNSGVGV